MNLLRRLKKAISNAGFHFRIARIHLKASASRTLARLKTALGFGRRRVHPAPPPRRDDDSPGLVDIMKKEHDQTDQILKAGFKTLERKDPTPTLLFLKREALGDTSPDRKREDESRRETNHRFNPFG